MFEEKLKNFYLEANSKGYFTERECANYAREKMGFPPLEKNKIFSALPAMEKKVPGRMTPISEEAKKLMNSLDAKYFAKNMSDDEFFKKREDTHVI